MLEIAASKAKKLEITAWSRKFEFKNSSANTRVTTWVDAECDGNISML